MGVTTKMAAWMKKQMKDVPAGSSKAEVKGEMEAIEMSKLSKAELNEAAKGRSNRAASARDEIERRSLKRAIKQGKAKDTEVEPGYNLSDPITPDMYRSWKNRQGSGTPSKAEKAADRQAEEFAMGKEPTKRKEAKNLSASEKKDLEESLKFKKGGLVKKKPVAAKKATPAAKSRTNALNKYYGK